MRRTISALIALAVLTVTSCASPLAWKSPDASSTKPLIGVYEPGSPNSWASLDNFTSLTGVNPRLVEYYSGWPERFRAGFAQTAWHHGATVLVQLEPRGVSLESIIAGASDEYLKSYATAVRKFGHPVILSFAHEMNGNWYSWGRGHVTPRVFVAAWRHVVRVFRAAGAVNATWAWTVSSTNEARGALLPWWPGASWVDEVGIDGYYFRPSDTFDSVFGNTIADIRSFSNAPLIVPETAVGPNPNRDSQITALYADAGPARITGIIWFDVAQDNGLFHQDWRLENAPSALAAFAKAVRGCCVRTPAA